MDWKVFISTFLTIFIAEIGDKTQFAAFTVASQEKSIFTVAIATVLALSFAGLLGVFAGSFLGRFIDPEKMKFLSGIAFICLGTFIIFK